jgi:hypothetical protein
MTRTSLRRCKCSVSVKGKDYVELLTGCWLLENRDPRSRCLLRLLVFTKDMSTVLAKITAVNCHPATHRNTAVCNTTSRWHSSPL